jgi:hypothetical protein
MATLTIPILDGEPFVDQTSNLDGTDYLLQFRFNQREQRYYLSIYLADGTPLAKGAVLVCMWPLFKHVTDRRMPPGTLFVAPQGSDTSPPKLGELGPGKRCELIYVEKAGP